jgi:NAD(P)H-hydrate epimerase
MDDHDDDVLARARRCRGGIDPTDEIDDLRSLGVQVLEGAGDDDLRTILGQARVAVDALTGIGARGPLREPLRSTARTLNVVADERRGELIVLALDVPSGVDADSGAASEDAVCADLTVTLGAVKNGLLRFPGAEHVGRLVIRPIGIPATATADLPYRLLDEADLAGLVPARSAQAHKYRFGRVLLVAGSDQYPGAATLCAAACMRVGAGLATLVSTALARQVVAAHVPEVTYTAGAIALDTDAEAAVQQVQRLLPTYPVLAIGPGLGRSPATTELVRRVLAARPGLEQAERASVVVDGDALFVLADWDRWWEQVGPNVILTPHAGELARLTQGVSSHDEGKPEWQRATELSRRWGCVLVAKGPYTTIAEPSGRAAVWAHANPALATAGTGDVLAGTIAGLLAQGAAPGDAARLGVAVHAGAARRVTQRTGGRTLVASDLPAELSPELARLAPPSSLRAQPA